MVSVNARTSRTRGDGTSESSRESSRPRTVGHVNARSATDGDPRYPINRALSCRTVSRRTGSIPGGSPNILNSCTRLRRFLDVSHGSGVSTCSCRRAPRTTCPWHPSECVRLSKVKSTTRFQCHRSLSFPRPSPNRVLRSDSFVRSPAKCGSAVVRMNCDSDDRSSGVVSSRFAAATSRLCDSENTRSRRRLSGHLCAGTNAGTPATGNQNPTFT
jgi:hypothetical protein